MISVFDGLAKAITKQVGVYICVGDHFFIVSFFVYEINHKILFKKILNN